MERFSTPAYRDDEQAFAAAMHQTVRPEEIEMAGRHLPSAWRDPKPLFDGAVPLGTERGQLHGSTDVGDVSWIAPTAQCFTTCFAYGTSPHSWQWVAQGKSSMAHKGMLIAAKTIAATALELLATPDLLSQAKTDLHRQRGGKPYVCPIPKDVKPPIPALPG